VDTRGVIAVTVDRGIPRRSQKGFLKRARFFHSFNFVFEMTVAERSYNGEAGKGWVTWRRRNAKE
jgi:hypothetical protein